MSTYPRRVVLVNGETFAASDIKYCDAQIAFQPFGRLVIGYEFAGSGTLSIALEHQTPSGEWAAPGDTAIVTGVSAPAAPVIDSYGITWGTNVRWKIWEAGGAATLTSLYVWIDLA